MISNEHVVGVQDVSPNGLQDAVHVLQPIAQQMASTIGGRGVNVLNASGENSDQSVDHLHFHVVPRRPDDGLDPWISGQSTHQLGEGWLEDFREHLTTGLVDSG